MFVFLLIQVFVFVEIIILFFLEISPENSALSLSLCVSRTDLLDCDLSHIFSPVMFM